MSLCPLFCGYWSEVSKYRYLLAGFYVYIEGERACQRVHYGTRSNDGGYTRERPQSVKKGVVDIQTEGHRMIRICPRQQILSLIIDEGLVVAEQSLLTNQLSACDDDQDGGEASESESE